MKVSDYIAKFLYKNKVEYIFELSGGMITNILDSIYKEGDIQIISMHHEQGASFAVDGFSRSSPDGKIGVAMATSGPGATNLLTGIASCYFDSVPAIFITGQVNQKEQKGQRNIRQLGFQETDILSMVKPISKMGYLIESKEDIPTIFAEAFKIAQSNRPGPVLIDIPMNIQSMDIEVTEDEIEIVEIINSKSDNVLWPDWSEFYSQVSIAKKPIILAGRGIISSKSEKLLADWSGKLNIPVVTSLLGIGAINTDEKLRVGMIGTYGNRWANLALADSDLIIVLGSRLDIRQTGADVAFFEKNRTIYHIDIEPNEINNRLKNCIPIVANVSIFLSTALDNFPLDSPKVKNELWINEILDLKNKWPDTEELLDIAGINPNVFIKYLSQSSSQASVFLADVGSHQMWSAQSLKLIADQKFITSGGMGAMGYALPAAIGAYFATRKPIVTISGDGGFQLNIQELETIAFHKLPIKIIILNNRSLGMIRQFQDSYFDGRHQGTVWGYSAPDFCSIANAYKISSYKIKSQDDIAEGLELMWADVNSPFLLEVEIDSKTNVYPKIAFGKPINEMEPFSKAIEMEGT